MGTQQNQPWRNPDKAPAGNLPNRFINPDANNGAQGESSISNIQFYDRPSTNNHDQFGDPWLLSSGQHHNQQGIIINGGERNMNNGINGSQHDNRAVMMPFGTVGPSYTNREGNMNVIPPRDGGGVNNNGNNGTHVSYHDNLAVMIPSGTTVGPSYANNGNIIRNNFGSGSDSFQGFEGNGGGRIMGGYNMANVNPQEYPIGGDYNGNGGNPCNFYQPSYDMPIDTERGGPSMYNNYVDVRDANGFDHNGNVGIPNFHQPSFAMVTDAERAGPPSMYNNGGDSSVANGSDRESWKYDETMELLDIVLKHDPYLEASGQRKDAWEIVASLLNQKGHGCNFKNGKKCKEKYDNLMKYYTSPKDPNSKHTYKYSKKLDNIMQRRQSFTTQPPRSNIVNKGPSASRVNSSSIAPVTGITSAVGMVYPTANTVQAEAYREWQRGVDARLDTMEARVGALEELISISSSMNGNPTTALSSENQQNGNAEQEVHGANDTDVPTNTDTSEPCI